MKKVLFLILASFLVLTACGNKEEIKSEDKKESKSSSKDDKKKEESKKSNDDKKEKSDKEDTDKKEDSTTDDTQQENNEQQKEAVEQPQSTQEPVQQPQTVKEQPVQQEPTLQEKANANAKVAKEHGYTGIPNGDAMSDVPVGQIELTPEELAKEEAKPEYQDVIETEEEADARMGE